ncbi:MAG: hypothetical protein IPH44_21535 [Myxococcales bacterium]|nr:hypothetical protein [Myxococcales bacterium]MBK7191938.1 hypothetical protein [Myxococcales bacterium]MBP6849231.1 hypothetical protein [Kofleriaceae bacterium]
MRAIAIAAVMLAACDGGAAVGDDGTPCPDVELAGGWFPVGEQPGVYVVEIVQGETHLTAGFTIAAPEPTPAMPRDVRAFVAPDRWLRLTTTSGVRVQECRRGGTEAWGCDELGPPTGGRLVGYRDGVQDVELSLWAPSWPVMPVVEGCPLLFNGHVDPAR